MLASILLAGALLFADGPDAIVAPTILDVPYRSQLDGSPYARANCGPTALAMVLAFYGIDASLWDLRVSSMKAQHSWVSDEGGYSHSYGVFIYNLASVAESMGAHVGGLWRREGARVDSLREWRASDLRREVQTGHPVVVQVAYRALPGHIGSWVQVDHYVVVHGLVGDDFVYSDPLGGPREVISEPTLMDAMAAASSPGVGFAVTGRT
jgi:uncharacterized protein YvpB